VAVEHGALDPYAMLGLPRGESSRPTAATAERRYRELRRTDSLKLGLDIVHAKANVVQTFAVRLQPCGERVAPPRGQTDSSRATGLITRSLYQAHRGFAERNTSARI
jgi:hypothetical protein